MSRKIAKGVLKARSELSGGTHLRRLALLAECRVRIWVVAMGGKVAGFQCSVFREEEEVISEQKRGWLGGGKKVFTVFRCFGVSVR
jgi:hypothetical protein